MLDEQSRRRPECDPRSSVPVRLADGGEWLIRKPVLELRAVFAGGKAAGTYPAMTCGPELDALIEAVSEAEDNAAVLIGAATLGAALLAPNYELTDDELDTLFAGRPDDPDSWDWAMSVMDVATGRSRPKRSAVG